MTFPSFEKLFYESQVEMEEKLKSFPWSEAGPYAAWLADSHYYVSKSTRILAMAAAHLPPELTALSNRFISHAAEETGHEKLLERDLKELGFDFKKTPVSAEMKLYQHSLYYYMSPNGSPEGIIGWILSLEGIATHVGPWAYSQTLKAFGNRASNFLRVHAEEDPDHLQKALKISASLSEKQLDIVAEALSLYSRQYCQVLESCSRARPEKVAA